MTRLAAVVGVAFGLGAGVMSALTGIIGGLAEAAALGVVGVGLVGSSFLLNGRTPSTEPRRARSAQQQRVAS